MAKLLSQQRRRERRGKQKDPLRPLRLERSGRGKYFHNKIAEFHTRCQASFRLV